jgi:adenine-specific DNA-methyltransferase
MSNEEAGREEKFFHTTIDRVDIDVLREPKVLTGFERVDSGGVHTITDPSEIEFFDEDGNLTENLLIKGNNLIALYSLRSRLAGKVKLIYIDPPYNTGNDGFRYNDNFNHSSWLVFMKNRLEIARELLREDGVMLISCDDNEQAYLKVLMDEVF